MSFVEDCHWIAPVFPVNVSVVELVPEQTVAPPETLPETDVGETVIVAEPLLVEEQTPLVTTASQRSK